jgi:hypothetical protein
MGAVKRYLEELSEEMGFGGEINEEVLAEARRRAESKSQAPPKRMAPSESNPRNGKHQSEQSA